MAIILALVLATLGAEIVLRLHHWKAYGIPPLSLIVGVPPPTIQRSPFLLFGPRVEWEVPDKDHPELARFDERGIRTVQPVGPRPDGEVRILTLGGSTTENVWNEAGMHWPWATECRLREMGRSNVRVLNGGMSAYTTAHSLVRLALDLVDLEPSMVLLMHNINDLSVNYEADARGTDVDPNYLVKYRRQRYTGFITPGDVALIRVFRAIRIRLDALRAGPRPRVDDVDIDEGLRIFSRNLRTLAAVSGEHGIRLVLLTMPFSRSPERYAEVQALAEGGEAGASRGPERHDEYLGHVTEYNEAIRAFARDRDDVDLIDMARLVDDEDFFVDTVHYSEAGIVAFGSELAGGLDSLLSEVGAGGAGGGGGAETGPRYPRSSRCTLLEVY